MINLYHRFYQQQNEQPLSIRLLIIKNKRVFCLLPYFTKEVLLRYINKTGKISTVMDGLKNPHGGWQSREVLMATSTASGEVRLNDDVFLFQNLEHKPQDLGEMEWLQNSKK